MSACARRAYCWGSYGTRVVLRRLHYLADGTRKSPVRAFGSLTDNRLFGRSIAPASHLGLSLEKNLFLSISQRRGFIGELDRPANDVEDVEDKPANEADTATPFVVDYGNFFGRRAATSGLAGALGVGAPVFTQKAAPSSTKGVRASADKRSDNLGYIKGLSGSTKQMVKKFINICMSDGKKTKARALSFRTFQSLAEHGDIVIILESAIENVKPICEIKRVRVGGTTHDVPATIPKKRQERLAMRWILEGAKKRHANKKRAGMAKALADEILDAYKKAGHARKKRDDLHKLAEANRTLAHYRWW